MPHSPAPPFAHSLGPRDAKIALVGEAFGAEEEKIGRPFMGAAGHELTRMLSEAGIARREVFLTNVLALRPPDNNLKALCASKKEVGANYGLPPLSQGKYLLPKYIPELQRLADELQTVAPNIVVALGGTAAWALVGNGAIGSVRGYVTACTTQMILRTGLPLKVLPTYHPAGVLRNWSWRPIAIADLLKAKRQSEFPEIRQVKRRVLVNPTLEEVRATVARYHSAPMLACDIETSKRQITMIGFAASRYDALVVPFITPTGDSYWPDVWMEVEARKCCRELLKGPPKKLFQNGMYDIQYLLEEGYDLANCEEDTMLLHHALYPEMQKSLGFLGSVYSDSAAWKHLRGKSEELKRDE